MNKRICLLSLVVLSGLSFGQSQQDRESIKDMAGCYEISFNFAETFSPDKNYQKKDNYKSGGLEWVEVIEDKNDKISLQHLLVIDEKPGAEHAVIKHWRQDWLYENTDFHQYHTPNYWKYVKLPKEQVKGQWTQRVFQVDDTPRYEGTGTWIHVDGRNYWESNADSPLPRREHTVRDDYNVLNRNNRHEIHTWGWMHDQDNKKVLRENGKEDKVIVEEKGKEYYTKVPAERCINAQNWWKENKGLWANVRGAWEKELSKNKDLKLEKYVNGRELYKYLFELKPNQTKEAEKIINKFIK
ncbi:DUF6607 family protein [Elizabethkingia sp. JS20170427COW]|uniref:DUF6607 family protein n=1 Tax=Elizabethkingia sp. JS20170427COW TaxID=2583851 RepID=UPI001110123F|nr:DUF6607 family protein [Elizabethkingia sp. JS20170427COW]QCX53082.1 hypothetical protein FGE20_04710 [Elizabethkingia sp. JS20170427COW]